MSADGWIRAHRALLDHPLLQKPDAFTLWMSLLLRAQWAPKRVAFKGKGLSLERGQVAISVLGEAEKLGVTHKRIRGILGKFRDDGMIKWVNAEGKACTIVTICNYERFQGESPEEGQSQGQSKGKRRANEGQTEQEREERKKEEKAAGAARGGYAWVGSNGRRLTREHFDTWKGAYHALPDLAAELQSLDDWFSSKPTEDQKDWFHAFSGILRRRHSEALARQPRPKPKYDRTKDWLSIDILHGKGSTLQ